MMGKKTMQVNVWKSKIAIFLFFVLLFGIGLYTIADYTGSYDEIVQQTQLKVNLREYAVLFEKVGIRWETALQMEQPPIDEFINRDYGMAAMYICAPFLDEMHHSQTFASWLWGGATWLWFMAGLWSLYSLSRMLGVSRAFSCIAVLLFYLCPRLFAHAHFNDKDILFLCLVLLCLWQGGRFLQKISFARAFTFSLSGALAFNLRAIGLMPWGIIGLCVIVKLTLKREWSLKMILMAAWTFLAFGLCYFLITPAVWRNPGAFLEYLFSNAAEFSRWSGKVFFRSAAFEIPANKLPYYYIPYMIAVTTPLYVLALAATGQVRGLLLLGRKNDWQTECDKLLLIAAVSLCWVLPLAAYVLIRPVVYNGWRHFYFSFAGLAVLAGYGAYWLWQKCARKKWSRYGYMLLLGSCIVTAAAGIMMNHPHQASYYNVLASRHQMETDYWNTGGTDALKKLIDCEHRNKELPLEVGCYFLDIQNARFKISEDQKAILTTTVARDAPYLYYNENYVQVYNVSEPAGYRVLFEVESYGRLIGTMYERE